jgi:hypothetical protein
MTAEPISEDHTETTPGRDSAPWTASTKRMVKPEPLRYATPAFVCGKSEVGSTAAFLRPTALEC